MKKNIISVVLTLSEQGVNRFQTVPVFKQVLHPNVITNLKAGQNIINVNHYTYGKLKIMASNYSDVMIVRKNDDKII